MFEQGSLHERRILNEVEHGESGLILREKIPVVEQGFNNGRMGAKR